MGEVFIPLILLSIVGLCSGLQAGLEYQYRYNGRVATGITDVRHQFSAAGIQADVTVQVEEDHTTVFKFSNVEVGDFHDDITCDIRAPIPMEYHELEEGVHLMEEPFKVITINGSQVMDFMEAPDEPTWITNIRRSVVNIFRIQPFHGVRDEHSGASIAHSDFFAEEETMSGHCFNWYQVLKLPETETAKVNHQREQVMEEDAQREDEGVSGSSTKLPGGSRGRKVPSKSSKGAKGHGRKGHSKTASKSPSRLTAPVPSIDDTLWSVLRTTDFKQCKDLITMKSHLKCGTEDLVSRSSVGTYIIRGDLDNMRIESAVIEGSITVFTQDNLEEHIDTFTNQTLVLKLVRPLRNRLAIEYETHQSHSWHYEIEHSIADEKIEGIQPTLEEILTGVEITGDVLIEIKTMINTAIGELSDRMPRNPTHTDHLVGEMSHVVDAVAILNNQQLEEIYDQYIIDYRDATSLQNEEAKNFHLRKIIIFKKILISAGTEPAFHFLLSKISDEEFRREYPQIVFNFLSLLPTIVKSPSSIPKIMEVVMQLPWDTADGGYNYEKSNAIMSFSKLVHNMCLSTDRRCTHWDTSCQQGHICSTGTIFNTYLQYLQAGLEDEESPKWQRLIYLQAISLLGTPKTISVLQPYIMGSREASIEFRTSAIWSLSKDNLPNTAVAKVYEMLMPVFDNLAEHHQVRSIAFLVMATWADSLSWWQQMAVTTWHEPSNKVANFVSTTIKTTAHMLGGQKQVKHAARVEHLAKPAAPGSITQSVNHYLQDYISSNEIGVQTSFAWLASAESIIPSDVYLSLKWFSFFGFTANAKLNVQQINLHRIAIRLLGEMYSSTLPSQDILEVIAGMYADLQDDLRYETVTEVPELSILLKYKNIFQFFPTGVEVTRYYHLFEDIHKAHTDILYSSTPTYHRHIDAVMAVPTDLGVPFIAKLTSEHASWLYLNNSEYGTSRQVKGLATFTFDASMMTSLEGKTLVPWSHEKFAIGTVAEDVMSILLPISVNYQLNREVKELQVTLEPITNDKVTLIDIHNLPYTVQHGAFPTTVHSDQRRVIKQADEYLYTRKTQVLPSVLGLSIESEWKGDIRFPFNIMSIYKSDFHLFTPTLKAWDYHLIYDPEASTTKSLSTTFTYVSTEKSSGLEEVPAEFDNLGQESQDSFDYFSQVSQGMQDYQEFAEVDSFVQEQSPTRQRIARLQEQVVPASGGHVRSISFDFSLQGTPPNKEYELVITWATGIVSSKSSTKFQITWIKDVPQGVLAEPHATCVNVQFLKPFIQPLVSVEELLAIDLHSTMKLDIHDGVNCDESPVLEIEGSLEISEEQMTEVRRKLTDEHCGSTSDYLPIDFITSSVYDHIDVKAQWTEGFPIQLKNLSYHGYDFVRGYYFPDISYDYTVSNPGHHIEIDYNKDLKTNLWSIHTTKPTEVSIVENAKAFDIFNIIATPASLRETLIYNYINGRQHHVCVIGQEKIRTTDGLEIPYEPDSCWNVIALDISGEESGSVEVRFHDIEWEARLNFPRQGLQFEMTKSSVMVNGEEFSGHDTRFDIIYGEDSAMLVYHFLVDNIIKVTTDGVYYLESALFRSMVGGLCGNFDGDTAGDMVGPKGCVYTDPDLFVKSWTTPGSGCRGFTYLGKKRPVQAYQDVCHQRSYVPTGISHSHTLTDCTDFEYQERTEGIYTCKALVPTPVCKSGCRGVLVQTQKVEYDCVVTEASSDQLNKCHSHEYPTTYPGYCIIHH